VLRKLYDWTLAKAAHPHAEWWLALFAFVEASFFPVPPHPLLGIMCLAEPKKAIRFAMIATVASVAGGLLGYAIGWGLYDTLGTQILSALGLTASFPKAACYLNDYGFWIFVAKGATPIPFKLLTITAGFIGMDLLRFIAGSGSCSGCSGRRSRPLSTSTSGLPPPGSWCWCSPGSPRSPCSAAATRRPGTSARR
jgi:membrane protein YqaA with SNARE-associated domain